MNNINIYFFKYPIGYKWIPGDRHIARFFKRLLNIKSINGAEKVFLNLCKGFDLLNIKYNKNPPFNFIKPNEPVIILGDELYNSKQFLIGYDKPNAIIAGIGLMTHPSEWPDLLQQYPVTKYLQHCTWANNLFIPYYGKDVCQEWPAGIETEKWAPDNTIPKEIDFLIYDKIRWDTDLEYAALKAAIIKKITSMGASYHEIVYGHYEEKDYLKLVHQSKAMIYISAHETQGFALCEAMSANVPVFAWDPGYCQDPARFNWNDPVIKTTSIPFFDDTCGMSFTDTDEFLKKADTFWQKVQNGHFTPREYVVKNISLKVSAQKMLAIIAKVYQ
ncbi:MAG: glycosyltransferase family 1 protein [Bacteroidota bacterium]